MASLTPQTTENRKLLLVAGKHWLCLAHFISKSTGGFSKPPSSILSCFLLLYFPVLGLQVVGQLMWQEPRRLCLFMADMSSFISPALRAAEFYCLGHCVAVCLQWNAEAIQVSALGWGQAYARAEREHLNVQRLRFSSVLPIFISVPVHFQISVISLSLVIVASWVLTLLLFMWHVKAKGFAVTKRLEDCTHI